MTGARFQSFEDATDRAAIAPGSPPCAPNWRGAKLAGFVVPRADRHQNEYVAAIRRAPGVADRVYRFRGTGDRVADRAALFVDGRYTLQAREQIDPAIFSIVHIAEVTPEAWLEANLTAGDALGFDPWLHTVEGAERLAQGLRQRRRDAGRRRDQPDRRDLARPPCSAARPRRACTI